MQFDANQISILISLSGLFMVLYFWFFIGGEGG